jgi:hypothetical protein
MFYFLSRRQADCEDTYRWLLTKDKTIAKDFREKWKGAEKVWLKKRII